MPNYANTWGPQKARIFWKNLCGPFSLLEAKDNQAPPPGLLPDESQLSDKRKIPPVSTLLNSLIWKEKKDWRQSRQI